MRCNYHNHTYRCGHACGMEEDYIRKAIAEGIYILGFSDHSPYPLRDGYVSYSRMGVDEIDGYCQTLLSLREKYKNYIDIKIGFETEYYPKYFDSLLELYRPRPIEYMIYAGHFIGNDPYRVDVQREADLVEDILRIYGYNNVEIPQAVHSTLSYAPRPDKNKLINIAADHLAATGYTEIMRSSNS